MGHPRRYYPSGTPYFVTNRVAEGLPFVACLYVNLMLLGVLARARFRFPSVIICGWIFLANHYHGIVVLKGSPDDFKDFMNYFQGEVAKLVVRWRGTRNVNVWAQRYHAAPILTWDSVVKQMVYLFLNPVSACFVDKAADWFGCTTYYAFHEEDPREYKWVRPRYAGKLPNAAFSKSLVRKLLAKIDALKLISYVLPIEPFAWIECFPEALRMGEGTIRAIFFQRLSEAEAEARQSRAVKRQNLLPRKNIEEQNPHKKYKPTTFGRRVLCICSCPELRDDFIALYRGFCERAVQAFEYSKKAFTPCRVPPGGFAPAIRCNSSLLPVFEFL